MYRKILLILIVIAALSPLAAYSANSPHIRRPDTPIVLIHSGKYPICGKYRLAGEEIIEFNANEIKLICGDPEVAAWKTIPEYQAKFSIKNFLQNRGYFYPEFEERGDLIVVHLGDKTKVSEIVITGIDDSLLRNIKIHRKRDAKHYRLTPDLLTSLDNWLTARLNNIGYPCADVSVKAKAASGDVTVDIDPGDRQNFPIIKQDRLKELDSLLLKRYYAFKEGKLFNQKLLTLTSRRTETNGIVQNTYFVTDCDEDDGCVSVEQKASAGKPRLFIIGVGVDTEEIVKGKISWKHARLGKNASSIKVEALGSYRRQQFTTKSDWYIFNKPTTRWYLKPNITFERRYERHYDYITSGTSLLPAVTWDGQHLKLALNFGPRVSFTRTYKTYRGVNTGFTYFLSAVANLNIISHNYEFYDINPLEGFVINMAATLNSRDALSSVTVQQLGMYGEWLLNLGNWDPSLVIFGLRFGIGTTITNRNDPHFGNLPPEFSYYLGGSKDLRGFKREELPITFRALTGAFACFETRIVNTFPFGLQPIAFVDIGAMGSRSLGFDRPVYWSPGFGARLYSMIGVFRATLAHGFMIGNNNPANNRASHWQFYFSYGEEF